MSLENILGLDKGLVIKFKQVFLLLNMSFKLPFKIIYPVKKERKIIFFEWGWTKTITHYEFYGKQITKMNTTSDNTTYLVDNQNSLC